MAKRHDYWGRRVSNILQSFGHVKKEGYHFDSKQNISRSPPTLSIASVISPTVQRTLEAWKTTRKREENYLLGEYDRLITTKVIWRCTLTARSRRFPCPVLQHSEMASMAKFTCIKTKFGLLIWGYNSFYLGVESNSCWFALVLHDHAQRLA